MAIQHFFNSFVHYIFLVRYSTSTKDNAVRRIPVQGDFLTSSSVIPGRANCFTASKTSATLLRRWGTWTSAKLIAKRRLTCRFCQRFKTHQWALIWLSLLVRLWVLVLLSPTAYESLTIATCWLLVYAVAKSGRISTELWAYLDDWTKFTPTVITHLPARIWIIYWFHSPSLFFEFPFPYYSYSIFVNPERLWKLDAVTPLRTRTRSANL